MAMMPPGLAGSMSSPMSALPSAYRFRITYAVFDDVRYQHCPVMSVPRLG